MKNNINNYKIFNKVLWLIHLESYNPKIFKTIMEY